MRRDEESNIDSTYQQEFILENEFLADTLEEAKQLEEKSSSYEKINYKLRPAKSIERKMMIDLYSELRRFEQFRKYIYVGLGSPFFSDFILCHKHLGINEMYSIEKNEKDKDRFEFNTPYRCIEMKFGSSSSILPLLPWDKKAIVWLDYDSKFNSWMLDDVRYLVNSLKSGSIFSFSFNCNIGYEKNNKHKLKTLKEMLGGKVPLQTKPSSMSKDKLPNLLQKIVNNEITSVLANKNAVNYGTEKELFYKQLFNFTYKDGVLMQTIGGIIYSKEEEEKFEQCNFSSYEFVNSEENVYHIHAPSLTLKEIKYLDSHLPDLVVNSMQKNGIPQSDILSYAKHYRFFPNFAEIES